MMFAVALVQGSCRFCSKPNRPSQGGNLDAMSAPLSTSTPSPAAPVVAQQAAPQRKYRRVYSVSFAHSKKASARKPAEFTREQFGVLLRQLVTQHFSATHTPDTPVNKVCKVMVFKELHADTHEHIYAGILAERPWGPDPVKRALQDLHRIYVSFGSSHTYFWTLVIYGGVPSVHKGPDEIDRDPWNSEGLTLREELAAIPKGASIADKERVRNFLGIVAGPGARGSSSTLTKTEFVDRIRDQQWRRVEQIAAVAREERADNPILYDTMVKMGQKEVEELLTWFWLLEGKATETEGCRLKKLRTAAQSAPCVCSGRWVPAAERLLQIQGLDATWFRAKVVRALQLGRNKGVNVLIVGVPDAGKSFIFKVLPQIYDCFEAKGENDNYPLQELPAAEICVLQDMSKQLM